MIARAATIALAMQLVGSKVVIAIFKAYTISLVLCLGGLF